VLAVALVAPFAALEAQDKAEPAPPPTVDAAIRAATGQKSPEVLDSAAAAYEKSRKYDEAQQLLESSLTLRAQTSGQTGSAYAIGLMKLGDLAVKRHQYAEAEAFYTKAVALGDTHETGPALIYLGARALGRKDTIQAADFMDRVLNVSPTGPLAGRALTFKGNIAMANGLPGVAEMQYLQALAQDPPNSSEAALTMETYAKLLADQSRTGEAQAMRQNAMTIREARVAEISPKWAGAGSAPTQPNAPNFRAAAAADSSNDGVALAQKLQAARYALAARTSVDAVATTQEPARAAGAAENSPNPTGDVFRVGNGVSAPILLAKVEPSYSEEALAAKLQGTVVLHVVIGTDGQAYTLNLVRSLGFGLDEQAAEAVTQWKFQPGKRDGMPVAVEAVIEVNFRLL